MNQHEQLTAYLATLATLALVVIAALIVGSFSPAVMSKMEVFSLGTVTGGLIGVLRIPTARTPVNNTESGDINTKDMSDDAAK